MSSGAASARRPIRVAVVGLGWVSRTVWLPMLAEHPDFEIVELVDPSVAAARKAAEFAPAARVLTDVADVDADGVDLAVVAVPNYLHASVAAGLLRRGVPAYVEKPVCLTSAEAVDLAEAEREGGSVLLAGSAGWHRADVKALRGIAGELGTPRALELSWVRGRGVPAAGSWFTRHSQAGGGALFDLGWHLLNIGMRLLNWSPVRQVVGTTSADFLCGPDWQAGWREEDPPRPAGGDVEDTARGCLVTEDGVFVTLTASWASHSDVDRTRIVVEGVKGRADLLCTFGFSPHRLDPVLTVSRGGAVERVDLPREPVGAEYRRQLDILPALLAEPTQPGKAAAETARTVSIIERFYASARPSAS